MEGGGMVCKCRKGLYPLKIAGIVIIFSSILLSPLVSRGYVVKKDGKIVLQYSDHTPPITPVARAAMQWQKVITEKTGGRIEFQNAFAGALLKEDEIFRGIEKGIADIAWYPVNPRDGFLLSTLPLLPFLGWPNREAALKIYEELFRKFPAMQNEWRTVKIVSISFMPPTHFHMAINRLLKKPHDIRGLKIATTGEHTNIIKALGATPVEIPIGDWYTALERRVVEGCLNHFGVAFTFKFLELLKTHTLFGEGGINITPVFMIMNLETWNKLPREVQEVFDASEVRRTWTYTMWDLEEKETLIAAIEYCKQNKHQLYYLSETELAEWRNAVKKQVHDKWMEEGAKRGLPAKQLYDEAMKLISSAHK
ncbi:MAG: TRAP transporter substrate-binding protein DctP [Candidatus Bathyarchaeia archaeon]